MTEHRNGQFSIIELLDSIKSGAIKPEDLSEVQYLACVEHLRFEEGWPKIRIAAFLGRNRKTVMKHINMLEEKRTLELRAKGIDVYSIASRLIWMTDVVTAKAHNDGDWRLYIDAYHKLIDKLQALGLLYHEPVKLDVGPDIMTAVLKALEPFMEARLAVSDALEKLENGHDN